MSAPAGGLRAARTPPAAWALALLLLAVVGPLVQIATAQPLVRYAQSAALVEHGSLKLDPYAKTLLVDKVEYGSHTYSDKAPLEAFLTAPVYAVGKAIGFDSAAVDHPRGNLGLWWQTLWSSTIPATLLVLLVHRTVRRTMPSVATLTAASLAFGTLLLPFSSQLYGHVLCTLFGFAAWLVADERGDRPGWALLAGALAGAAVATEYPMALVAAIVLGVLVVRKHWRSVATFVAGTVPFGAFLLWYQTAAFGGPFTDPYKLKPQHQGADALVTGLPKAGQALEILLGNRGLFVFAPVTLIGIVGLVRLARRAGPLRTHGVVGLLVFGSYWMLQSGWQNPWGGEMPGPRYMITVLPFLAVGIAEVAIALRPLVRVAAAWGTVAMLAPLLTVHLVFGNGTTVLAQVDNFHQYGATPPVWVLAMGKAGWLVYLAGVAGALALAVRIGRGEATVAAPEAPHRHAVPPPTRQPSSPIPT